MKITQVEYSELFTDNFNNFKVGFVAEVGPNDSPYGVLAILKEKVQRKLKEDHEEYQAISNKAFELRKEIDYLKYKCRKLRQEHKDQINALNGTLEQIMLDELPF